MKWFPPYHSVLMIANGLFPSKDLILSLNDPLKTLVAIDGGVNCFASMHLKPHLITGDFDSADPKVIEHYNDVMKIKMPDQNKTDLEKALEFFEEFDMEKIIVCGALGHRLDHTLANVSLLARYPGKVFYESENESCFAIPKTYEISCQRGQRLSLFPLGVVSGIVSSGLQWELNNRDLDKNFLGVSNICMQEHVSLSYEKGDLIICMERITIPNTIFQKSL